MEFNTYRRFISDREMEGKDSFKIGDKISRTLDEEPEENLGKSGIAKSFNVVGASARGKLHYHNGTPRDDAFVARFDGTWLAVAVADGAGSKELSRHGASFLVNKLCNRLLETANLSKVPGHYGITVNDQQGNGIIDSRLYSEEKPSIQQLGTLYALDTPLNPAGQNHLESIMLRVFRQTRADLERFARRKTAKLEDFHSTLLGMILNTETMEMGVGQIGDGLILGLDKTGKAVILAEPPATDDPAASFFITQEDWERYFYVRQMSSEEVNRYSTFYLMTDGVANDCQYGPPANILEMWAKDMDREIRLVPSLETTAERLKNYLASYKAKGSFDDRTLVVVYRSIEDGKQ